MTRDRGVDYARNTYICRKILNAARNAYIVNGVDKVYLFALGGYSTTQARAITINIKLVYALFLTPN